MDIAKSHTNEVSHITGHDLNDHNDIHCLSKEFFDLFFK